MNDDINAKVALWRQKHADGTLTLDDTRDFIKILRAGRLSALNSSEAGKRARAKAAIPNADDLLGELEGL